MMHTYRKPLMEGDHNLGLLIDTRANLNLNPIFLYFCIDMWPGPQSKLLRCK